MSNLQKQNDFTSGSILGPLLRFTLPILLALALQMMYGAVDLLVVGRFGTAADVSGVSTGTQILNFATFLITGLATGSTVLLGRFLGARETESAGRTIGAGLALFGLLGLVMTGALTVFARPLSGMMNAPAEAMEQTVQYVLLCGAGSLFIVAYNLLGSVFRGIGDSKTPLLAVAIACGINIFSDLLLVAVFRMGAAGAALATVLAQAISVLLCLVILRKRGLPFAFERKYIRFDGPLIRRTLTIGAPIALQSGLVSISFMALISIVNSLGLVASAGVGVAEKLCGFIMMVPNAFSQALSAFVAQNEGAMKHDRSKKALFTGIGASVACGLFLAWLGFFQGDKLASLFSADPAVIAAAADYLKAYAVDTLLVSFMFCFAGYFSGCGQTSFVMVKSLLGAFGVRIPVAWAVSRMAGVSLFRLGLATPASTALELVLCLLWFARCEKRVK